MSIDKLKDKVITTLINYYIISKQDVNNDVNTGDVKIHITNANEEFNNAVIIYANNKLICNICHSLLIEMFNIDVSRATVDNYMFKIIIKLSRNQHIK